MRICILTTSTTLHQMGGTEVQAETLATEAARQGHTVFMITTAHPDGLKTEKKDGYTVIYLPGTSYSMSRKEAPAWWAASAKRTAELCSSENIDVVWAENFSGLSYAAISASERRPVISIINGLGICGEIASNFNRVSTFGEFAYFATRYIGQLFFYYIPWFRAMVRDSDLLVGVSNESLSAVAKEFPSSANKIKAILNPVDTDFFHPDPELRRKAREELGFSESAQVILMAGVLNKQKGVHLGLEVFAQLTAEFPEARLLVVGDGPQRAELNARAQLPDASGKVVFCGMKSNKEMPRYYNAADIYLNPTLRLEGLPMVIIEAMSCGLPVIVSKIGGTGSTIDDGISGFFVKPGDMQGLIAKLKLILSDSELKKCLAAGAREKALLCFSKKKTLENYIAASNAILR